MLFTLSPETVDQDNSRDETNCPFLVPALTGPAVGFPVPVYCRAPNGRVRMPSREQLVSLCSGGHHHACPSCGRWQQAIALA
jgi:hypothetical protein